MTFAEETRIPSTASSLGSNSFDDTPLPTMSKASSIKFGDIQSRAKGSSIAFDYSVRHILFLF
jgi:hypothetical protein